MRERVVAKFGGSSLANASQVRKVIDIVNADPRRKIVVVSAPGARYPGDKKVTDLLIEHRDFLERGVPNYSGQLVQVQERFVEIARGLGVPFECRGIYELAGDALVSSGERYMAELLAKALGYHYVDASLLIYFDKDGRVDEASSAYYCKRMLPYLSKGIVVSGFSGSMRDMTVRNFSRGGSDISGSWFTKFFDAALYENHTDVSGVLSADPRIVNDPMPIGWMSNLETRELAYGGASVLHDEAVYPVREAKIPINVRNTNRPQDPGTMIVSDDRVPRKRRGAVTGIAGRKGFVVIAVEKAGCNKERGFGASLFTTLDEHEISWEHPYSSIDSLNVAIHTSELGHKLTEVCRAIKERCKPDKLSVRQGLALICVVGRAMAHTPGVLARVCGALAKHRISIVLNTQSFNETNIILGVEEKDYERAIRALYTELIAPYDPRRRHIKQ